MAQPPAMNRHVATVVKNLRGETILTTSMDDTTEFSPDGSVTKYRTGENIQLVCGSVWNPTMSMGENPAMLLSVCEFCRSPRLSVFNRKAPTHGLCSRAAGSTCAGCGAFLCPSHAMRCADGSQRCRRCSRGHAVRSLLTALFFKCEE